MVPAPPTATRPATALARAKLNLCLHVTGRRPDGYHRLDSLVAFAGLGDRVEVEPAARTSLTLDGPFATGLAADADNLVLRAAALMPGCPASIRLEKTLPVAAGIGGGSADAAATLSALAEAWDAPLPAPDQVLSLGADVPVCLAGRPARMRGIGGDISPVPPLPPLWTVLLNPLVACPTPRVFAALESRMNPGLPDPPPAWDDAATFLDWLRTTRNDLEAPAMTVVPAIAETLAALAARPGCALARMSGSGATVFGLFPEKAAALAAAEALRHDHPEWWTAAAPLAP